MKTLLSIGVLVAAISWSSGLKCWTGLFPGQDFDDDETKCVTGAPFNGCQQVECGNETVCRRRSGDGTLKRGGVGEIQTVTEMDCVEGPADDGCVDVTMTVGGVTSKYIECKCDSKLCNGADGASYTHLIITSIVGAIFLH